MSDLTLKGVVSLDTTNADQAMAKVGASAKTMADGVKRSAADAGAAVSRIGDGSAASAQKVDRDTKSMISQIKRLTAETEAGSKSSSAYFEALARQRGVSVDALRPYLQQLDAARSKQDAATGSLSRFGSLLGSLAPVLAGAFSARSFVQAADAITTLNNQLRLATGSAAEAGQAYNALFEIAQRSRASFTELGSTFASISRASEGLGLSQQQLLKLTEAIGNAVAISGSSAQASSAALVQLSQGLASGVLRGEELNSIMEQTPRLARAIADGLGVPIGKLREMGKEGELSAQTVINALQSQSNVLSGEVQTSVLTLGQAFTQLTNSATGLAGEIDRVSGSTNTMAQVMSSTSGSLDRISQAMRGVEGSGLDLASVIGDGIATTFEAVAALGANVAYVLTQVGKELGGLAAQAVAVAQLDFEAAGAIRRMRIEDADRDRREVDALTARIVNARSEAAKLRASLSGVDTRAEDARLSRMAGETTLRPSQTVKAKTTRTTRTSEGDPFAADREAAKGWADAVGDFTKMAAEAEGKSLGLSKAQARLVEYLGSPAYKNASEPMRELALQQAYVAIGAEQAAEALKKEQAAIEAAVNAMAGRIEGQQSRAAEIQEQVRQQTEATAAYGLSGDALLQLESARLLDAAAERERQAVIADGVDLSGMLGQAYRDEAQALRDLSAAKLNDAAVRKQKDAYRDLWQGVENFAENAFMDVAMNGEDAFKRIGQSIKREILQMLYEMTVKKWIIQIAGSYGGVGGGSGNMLMSAAQNYMTGGSAWGASANAVGSWATGSMSTANMAGSLYANYTGAGIDGLLATNGAYGTAASGGSAAGASSASWISAVGYVALIAAAVTVAQNLYAKGYTRAALGKGDGETNRFGYTTFTSDPNMGNSTAYNISPENLTRMIFDSLGMNEKWADILSGTTRMATLFGRKLGAYGYEAQIAGGDAEVGGFARYKGGLFRSNKTVGIEIDQRDAANVDAIVESTIEGARGMARAMGLSEEAINSYTGSIKVNMKGAETAEEQSKRMAEAMDDLQFSLLKAAAGGKYSKDEFEKMMEGVRKSIEAAGISTGGIADILVQGMTGRLSKADVGDQLAEMIIGGIYNSIASNYAGMIAQAFTSQIITPIFTALAAGVPISQAISQAAIQNVVATAQSAAQALNAIFNDAGFRQAIGGIQQAISGVAGAVTSVKAPKFGSAARSSGNQSAQQRYQLETELLTLLGNTDALRRRELASLSAGNRALQQRIWALEDAKDGVNNAMEALERAADARRKVLQDQLDAAAESEQALKDVFDVLRDNLRDIRGEVTPQTTAAQGRAIIREALGGQVVKAEDLSNAINAVREGIDATQYASRVERDRAMLLLAAELDTLAGSTEQGLSAAEQQVTLLEEQLAGIDSQLELAQKQVDALFGLDTSVKTVEQAVQALTVAMAGYSAAVSAAAAVKVSYGAAPGGSSGGSSGGGWISAGGGSTSTGWTAGGYWDKNPDLRDYYTQNADWLSKQFGGRDKYLEWHWQNQGQKERRKFATGAAFSGGVVQRPTLFNIGQMGEAGPEGILPLANIGGRLGVMSSSDQETKKLLREVIARLDAVAGNTEAGALHASRVASTLRKASREGGALAVQAAEGAPVKVEVIA